MKVGEFIESFEPKFREYCPCVIDREGEVVLCEKSHLDALIQMCGNPQILSEIPEETSPLFYLMCRLRCVVVDYENQIYCQELLEVQQQALTALAEANIIVMNPKSIHNML